LTETLTSPASAVVCRASDVVAPAAMRMIQDVVGFIASRVSWIQKDCRQSATAAPSVDAGIVIGLRFNDRYEGHGLAGPWLARLARMTGRRRSRRSGQRDVAGDVGMDSGAPGHPYSPPWLLVVGGHAVSTRLLMRRRLASCTNANIYSVDHANTRSISSYFCRKLLDLRLPQMTFACMLYPPVKQECAGEGKQ